MSPNAPLTDEQRNTVTKLRAMYCETLASLPRDTAESIDQRARRPDPGSLPQELIVRVEIAPPSPQPHPLLVDSGVPLKTPERVPIYFYTLRNDRADSDSDSDADLANTRVLFFIHGGGNITGHPTHLPFMQFYAQLLRGVAAAASATAAVTPKWVLVAPTYRLATVSENVFPAALQDLVAAYDYVLTRGYDPSNVFIAGDSAGGNHAVVLTHLVLHTNGPVPRGVIALAPASLLVFDNLSAHAMAQADKDVFDMPTLTALAQGYVGDSGVSRTSPLVSGAFVPFGRTWPRTLIIVGTADHLIDGAREVERRLATLSRPVELVEYDERPHGWWVMPHVFPENVQDAVERIARFVLS